MGAGGISKSEICVCCGLYPVLCAVSFRRNIPDADVEVLKNMDELLVCKSFLGYDSTGALEAAIIGAEPRCPWIGCALEYYEGRHFVRPDGKFDVRPIPGMIYEKLHQLFDFKDRPDRVQELPEITLFPSVISVPLKLGRS